MDIIPRYLIMVTPGDNHNKYYKMTPQGSTFTVEYGRVGQGRQTAEYPISQYEKKYKEKIKKGYQDVSDLRQDLITETTPTGEAAYKPTEISSIDEVLDYLMSVSRDAVKKNYTVSAASVTQAMVDEAQKTLDELSAAATTNYKEEVLFQVNYRTDLTTAHVVRYNGILYDITRIDTFEGYKEDLTLYCSRRARQS